VIKTEDLFTFELDLGADAHRPTGRQLEDILYNCLDFCLLYRKRAHFYLTGQDAAGHPELWHVLDILREEGATFSILSEPEQSAFAKSVKAAEAAGDKVEIRRGAQAYYKSSPLGNMLLERLADMLILSE